MVITREGIKEIFGYKEHKARVPYSSSWIEDFCKKDEVIINLIQLTKSKLIQKPEVLKQLIKALLEIRALPGAQGYHGITTLPAYVEIQAQLDNPISQPLHKANCIETLLRNTYRGQMILFTDTSIIMPTSHSHYGPDTKYEVVYEIHGSLELVEYIRVSEPQTYNLLISTIQIHINQCKQKAKEVEAQYQKVLNEYGEYLMFKEL
jgi:hypothetical protein